MVETTYTLLYLIFGYMSIGWYFDNVNPQNRGVPKPWYFLFQPSFWFSSLRSPSPPLPPPSPSSCPNSEQSSILLSEQSGLSPCGVRVLGLSKTYKSLINGKETQALQSVYFTVNKGELLGVMGHNGAGKSTLINVLCGLVYKDGGNARIYD